MISSTLYMHMSNHWELHGLSNVECTPAKRGREREEEGERDPSPSPEGLVRTPTCETGA